MRESKPSKISQHAAELMQRRRQRFYRPHGEKKDHCNITLSRPIISSASPVAIAAAQAAEASTNTFISITLLQEVTAAVHAPGGIFRNVLLPLNPKTLQLLAYLGWKHGTMVRRDVLLEAIWGYQRTGKETTKERLRWAFEGALKSLRSAIRETIERLNSENKEVLLNPQTDIFMHRGELWGLSPICRVEDLEKVEQEYQIILEAKNSGVLNSIVPKPVKDASDRLIAAYSGDFTQKLNQFYPVDTCSYPNAWEREPITYYRERFLQAIWYSAEYELQVGKRFDDECSTSDVESRHKQRGCWGRAAELYRMYAMSACNNRLDTQVFFKLRNRGDGQRVARSEQAIRLCVMLLSKLGKSYLVDETYSAYYDLMMDISDENWEPSEETLKEVQLAREQPATYWSEG